MADLTVDGYYRMGPGEHLIREWVLDNSAAQTTYKRQPMIIDVSEDTVYLRGFTSSVTLVTATDVFIGICASSQKSVLTTDTETDNKIDVIMSGLVGFPAGSLTDADVGKAITMGDSATVGTNAHAAGYCYIGRLEYVEDGYAYVRLNALNGGAPTIAYF